MTSFQKKYFVWFSEMGTHRFINFQKVFSYNSLLEILQVQGILPSVENVSFDWMFKSSLRYCKKTCLIPKPLYWHQEKQKEEKKEITRKLNTVSNCLSSWGVYQGMLFNIFYYCLRSIVVTMLKVESLCGICQWWFLF